MPAARAANCLQHGQGRLRRRAESGTVGPEAIKSNGSPSTSEMISVSKRPARQARGEPAPLDAAELLADRVQLLDVGPGGAEVPGHGQLVGQRDALRRGPATAPSRRRRSGTGKDRPARAMPTSRRISAAPATPLGRGLVDSGGPGGVQVDPP